MSTMTSERRDELVSRCDRMLASCSMDPRWLATVIAEILRALPVTDEREERDKCPVCGGRTFGASADGPMECSIECSIECMSKTAPVEGDEAWEAKLDDHVMAQDISHHWTASEEIAIAYQAAAEGIRAVKAIVAKAPVAGLVEALKVASRYMPYRASGDMPPEPLARDRKLVEAALARYQQQEG